MRNTLPLAALAVTLFACAPAPTTTNATNTARPALETQVYEGTGTGTFSSARYRLALNVDAAGGSANGVFYNLTSGNNYAVQGTYVPTRAGAEMALTVYSNAGNTITAFAVTRDFRLGADARQTGLLTGTLSGTGFTGKLRLTTANLAVQLRRVE